MIKWGLVMKTANANERRRREVADLHHKADEAHNDEPDAHRPQDFEVFCAVRHGKPVSGDATTVKGC